MWLIKGLFAGLVTAFLFTVFYYTRALGPWTSGKAVGVSVPQALFLHRPLYWVASGLIVLTVCVISRLFHTVR